jgi:hypothetical protein
MRVLLKPTEMAAPLPIRLIKLNGRASLTEQQQEA